jgi:hypothetical protein
VADARAIGLENPLDLTQAARRQAGADQGSAAAAAAGGHVGIGAVIDVQERALGPLEESGLSAEPYAQELLVAVHDHRRQALGQDHQLLGEHRGRQRIRRVMLREQLVGGQELLDGLPFQVLLGGQQVPHA